MTPSTWQDGTLRSTGNAFDILYIERAKANSATPPRKRGPRKASNEQRAANCLDTPEERKARILRKNKESNIAYSTRDNDKTLKIVGRRNEARSQ